MQQSEPTLPPASRRTDPATSHQSEQEITDSGVRATQTQRVAELVRAYPGRTCNELARLGVLTERQLSKRLSDAHAAELIIAGPPRRCDVSRRPARTWRSA